jgi:hypothetical protein
MPASWFNHDSTPIPRWENILRTLTKFSDCVISTTMQLLVTALGERAPLGVLKDASDRDFINWFNGTQTNLNFGQRGALTSVAWVAGRIAQGWRESLDMGTSKSFLFTHLINDGPHTWPAAGWSALHRINEMAWAFDPCSPVPFSLAPLDRIIERIIPGLQFDVQIRRRCRKCKKEWHSVPKNYKEIDSPSLSELKKSLDLVEVDLHVPDLS